MKVWALRGNIMNDEWNTDITMKLEGREGQIKFRFNRDFLAVHLKVVLELCFL